MMSTNAAGGRFRFYRTGDHCEHFSYQRDGCKRDYPFQSGSRNCKQGLSEKCEGGGHEILEQADRIRRP